MKTKVHIERAAARGLRKMPSKQRSKMRSGLDEIAVGNTRGRDIKKLQGREGYRYRLGKYRAIYRYEESTGFVILVVLDVGSRGAIY